MTYSLPWGFEQKDRRSAAWVLRKAARGRVSGLWVVDSEGRSHCLAYVDQTTEEFHEWCGEVRAFRLVAPRITADFGTEILCESSSLRLEWNSRVNGPVLYAGDEPLVAFSGVLLRSLPSGLRFLVTHPALPIESLQETLRRSDVAQLEALDVRGAVPLPSIDMFGHLTSLTALRLLHADLLDSIGGVRHLTKLHTLDINGSASLRSIDELEGIPLRSLSLDRCNSLRDSEVLRSVRTLRSLSVICGAFDTSILCDLPLLERLSLVAVNLDRQGLPLDALAGLRELDVGFTDWPNDLRILTPLKLLRRLSLQLNERIHSVAPLLDLPNLSELDVDGCYDVTDLPVLANAPSLRVLRGWDEEVAATVLARCCARRGDRQTIWFNDLAWLGLVRTAQCPGELTQAIGDALSECADEPWVRRSLSRWLAAMRKRPGIHRAAWASVLAAARRCGETDRRTIFEELLAGEPLPSDAQVEVLSALASFPESSESWAREFAFALAGQNQASVGDREFCAALARVLWRQT